MAKLTLTDVENLSSTTAVSAINTNNTRIEAALENTLSRNGTSPNEMDANLDMNQHRILNLPEPASNNEPLRLVDALDGVTITISESNIVFQDKLTVELATIDAAVDVIQILGYSAAGDGGAGIYKKAASEPSHPGKLQSVDTAWWELVACPCTPLQFGADPTNTNDSSTAFQSWFDYIEATENEGYIPAGTYRLDSRVTCSFAGESKYFKIIGAGVDNTTIVVNNSDGGFQITGTGGLSRDSHVQMEDFRLTPNIEAAGIGIDISFQGATGRAQRHSFLKNVYVGTEPDSGLGYFTTGVRMYNLSRSYVDNCDINGISGLTTDEDPITIESFTDVAGVLTLTITAHGFTEGERITYLTNGGTAPTGLVNNTMYIIRNVTANTFELAANQTSTWGTPIAYTDAGSGTAHTVTLENFRDDAPVFKMTTGIDVDEAAFFGIRYTRITSCGTAVKNTAGAGEAIYLDNAILVNCKIGLDWERTSARGIIIIKDSHCHHRDYGLYFNNAANIHLQNMSFSLHTAAQFAPDPPAHIYLSSTSGGYWDDLQIGSNGDERCIGIFISDDSINHTFVGPQFNGTFAYCISSEGAVSNKGITVIDPVFATGTVITSSPEEKFLVDAAGGNSFIVRGEQGSGTTLDHLDLIRSFNADANEGPIVNIVRQSPSPAAADNLGAFAFKGKNDASQEVDYARMYAIATAITDGTEEGSLAFTLPSPTNSGAQREGLRVHPYGISLRDGVTAPSAIVGRAIIYVDTADGDLKVIFGDGTTKTIVTDT